MCIIIWSENIHYEKHLQHETFSYDEALRVAKSLLAAGYKKVWFEIQDEY